MNSMKIRGKYKWELVRDGKVIWTEEQENLIVNAGLDYFLGVGLSDETPDGTHYVGLKDTGTAVAADTLASHASWAELTNYTGDRKEWVEAGVSSQNITNSASPASFTFTSADTIYGSFLCSAASGTSGTLISVGDFSASRAVLTDDVLNCTYTITAADA